MLADLSSAKAYLRVDHSHDDALITRLLEAATGYLDGPSGVLGRNEVFASDSVPASVSQAAIMLVAHWYDNRSAAASGGWSELPLGVRALLAPHRQSIV